MKRNVLSFHNKKIFITYPKGRKINKNLKLINHQFFGRPVILNYQL